MRVILVMVATIDGKITKWEEEGVNWASLEDASYFRQLVEKNNLFVMGRKTFEVARPKPQAGKLRIVISTKPSDFAQMAIADQLEFTNDSPRELVSRLKKQGFATMIVLGGSSINTTFLKESLIDELWLTVEPRIFGSGKALTLLVNFDISLKLISMEKLNDQGTLLLKYLIIDKESPIR